MKLKLLLRIISVLLAAKAVFGVLYIFMGWQASIAGWVIPMWVAILGTVVAAYLSYLTCKYSKGKK